MGTASEPRACFHFPSLPHRPLRRYSGCWGYVFGYDSRTLRQNILHMTRGTCCCLNDDPTRMQGRKYPHAPELMARYFALVRATSFGKDCKYVPYFAAAVRIPSSINLKRIDGNLGEVLTDLFRPAVPHVFECHQLDTSELSTLEAENTSYFGRLRGRDCQGSDTLSEQPTTHPATSSTCVA